MGGGTGPRWGAMLRLETGVKKYSDSCMIAASAAPCWLQLQEICWARIYRYRYADSSRYPADSM